MNTLATIEALEDNPFSNSITLLSDSIGKCLDWFSGIKRSTISEVSIRSSSLVPILSTLSELDELSVTFRSQSLIDSLDYYFSLTNPNEIKNFLQDNDFLLDILFEAVKQIERVFDSVPVFLELHNDPEEGWEELFVIIKSSLPTDEAIELENQLIEGWFIHRMQDTKGKLNIIEEPL